MRNDTERKGSIRESENNYTQAQQLTSKATSTWDISPARRFPLGYMKGPKEHRYKDKTDVNSLSDFSFLTVQNNPHLAIQQQEYSACTGRQVLESCEGHNSSKALCSQ